MLSETTEQILSVESADFDFPGSPMGLAVVSPPQGTSQQSNQLTRIPPYLLIGIIPQVTTNGDVPTPSAFSERLCKVAGLSISQRRRSLLHHKRR